MVKKAALTALAAGALGAGAAAAAVFFWPFQVDAALRKLALRRGGVERVRVAGLEAYVRDVSAPGAVPRCVALIHGLGDSALTWDKLLLGEGGAAAPPAGTTLFAFELPGSEGSAPPASRDGYAVPKLAEAVVTSMKGACDSWTVVGNSLGGWIAGWTALQWPRGVKRLVLLDAAGVDGERDQQVAIAEMLSQPTAAGMKEFSARAYFKPPSPPERAWPELAAAIASRPTRAIVDALRPEDLLDSRAQDIKAPTVVLWGAADRTIPRVVGERLASLIPGATFQLLPDCGHLPQRECPKAVTDVLYSEPAASSASADRKLIH